MPFPGVSRRHAEVRRHPIGIQLADLGSKNGLLRGDQRFSEIVLAPGESLQIGRAELRLEEVPSSDGEIVLRLPVTAARRDDDPPSSSDTDALREGAGQVTPGSALALVRRIEASSGNAFEGAEWRTLLHATRATLGAQGLVLLRSARDDAPAIVACDGLAATGICVVPLTGFNCGLQGFRVALLESDDAKFEWIFRTLKEKITEYLNG